MGCVCDHLGTELYLAQQNRIFWLTDGCGRLCTLSQIGCWDVTCSCQQSLCFVIVDNIWCEWESSNVTGAGVWKEGLSYCSIWTVFIGPACNRSFPRYICTDTVSGIGWVTVACAGFYRNWTWFHDSYYYMIFFALLWIGLPPGMIEFWHILGWWLVSVLLPQALKVAINLTCHSAVAWSEEFDI